ncbi:hypothetical protein SAY86_005599 [Trapa natans]|uniref:non-specific serine/threonine protein kinase n=1 Tax=Trapa natans TaxID=22666 RepID=A0AAN7QTM2_TRANT|nr:hypothetical protein SAY86_005599 [Trapa natans]
MMASIGIAPSSGLREPSGKAAGIDRLSDEMNEMTIREERDEEQTVVDGNGAEAGHIIVTNICGKNGQSKQTISYMAERAVGRGTFGVVFQAKCLETGETVAIKKVLQDKRFKNRELQTMRLLDHPNVVTLKHCFFSTTEKDELYLNLVLEYVPETVHRVIKHYNKMNQRMPLIYVKLYFYQICRALTYIHNCIGVCHRDIKPQNLLVNPHTHQLKLCDFGSAKVLVKGEPNVSYICSRYYRAPELIFGATEYTSAIDIWSAGCVLVELLIGQPLFPGESGVDQLVEIIKVLGTPTREEIKCMNPNYTEFKFPQIKAHPWHKIFYKHMPPEAVDLVSRLLQYSPSLRSTALEALVHPFFDELRDPNTRLPNGRPLPPLFNFKSHELKRMPTEMIGFSCQSLWAQGYVSFLLSSGTDRRSQRIASRSSSARIATFDSQLPPSSHACRFPSPVATLPPALTSYFSSLLPQGGPATFQPRHVVHFSDLRLQQSPRVGGVVSQPRLAASFSREATLGACPRQSLPHHLLRQSRVIIPVSSIAAHQPRSWLVFDKVGWARTGRPTLYRAGVGPGYGDPLWVSR